MSTTDQQKPRPVGRPTKYDPAYCDAIIEVMATGASATSFAAKIGVSRSTLNLWADAHPEFMEALNAGTAKCAAWWERQARAGASGAQVSAPLIIFGLKNMAAEDWREKQEIDHRSGDGSMTPKDAGAAVLEAIRAKHDAR